MEGRGLKVLKVKELWFIASKAHFTVRQNMRIPRDKNKIHNLYENIAVGEILKRRLRTSSDDLTINRGIEYDWHWVSAEVLESRKKKTGPNKERRRKKRYLSSNFAHLFNSFLNLTWCLFHKPFQYFTSSFTFAVAAFYWYTHFLYRE